MSALSRIDLPLSLDVRTREINSLFESVSNMTPLERVQLLWSRDEYGERCYEANYVFTVGKVATGVGFLLHSFQDAREANRRFWEENRHEMFASPEQAKSRLRMKLIEAFAKGGFGTGVRHGVFALMLASGYVTASVAAGSYRIRDTTAITGFMVALVKLRHGYKPMMAGAIFGSTLGFVAGCFITVAQYATGHSVMDKMCERRMELVEQRKLHQTHLLTAKSELDKKVESVGLESDVKCPSPRKWSLPELDVQSNVRDYADYFDSQNRSIWHRIKVWLGMAEEDVLDNFDLEF